MSIYVLFNTICNIICCNIFLITDLDRVIAVLVGLAQDLAIVVHDLNVTNPVTATAKTKRTLIKTRKIKKSPKHHPKRSRKKKKKMLKLKIRCLRLMEHPKQKLPRLLRTKKKVSRSKKRKIVKMKTKKRIKIRRKKRKRRKTKIKKKKNHLRKRIDRALETVSEIAHDLSVDLALDRAGNAQNLAGDHDRVIEKDLGRGIGSDQDRETENAHGPETAEEADLETENGLAQGTRNVRGLVTVTVIAIATATVIVTVSVLVHAPGDLKVGLTEILRRLMRENPAIARPLSRQ